MNTRRGFLSRSRVVMLSRFQASSRRKLHSASTSSTSTPVSDERCSVLAEISDEPGALYKVLSYFWKHDVQITAIESRPDPLSNSAVSIFLSFYGRKGEPTTDKLLKDLGKSTNNFLFLDDRVVPAFPKHLSDLDQIAGRVIDAEKGELQADHPGFSDPVYRERRRVLASLAQDYVFHQPIPRIEYTASETKTWGAVYRHLRSPKMQENACDAYNQALSLMEAECGYGPDSIPQACDISAFLSDRTGFRLRPVAGLLSSRDFLNALAFRVFFSTQYIRHHSRPLYTPEPDICHELLGHAPMFADRDFSDFSQEIGLASLGASDHDIKRLATCYWHSVEFGLLREGKEQRLKAYGAGVLSSAGEMEHAVSRSPNLLPWDPLVASTTEYPITSFQPTYFVANSLADACRKMRDFSDSLPKPFRARYNPLTGSIWVDRPVKQSGDTKL